VVAFLFLPINLPYTTSVLPFPPNNGFPFKA
jgi:hypothetical protein